MNLSKVKLLVYSDIHHDEYKNGLTGEDVGSIEDQFTEEIIKRNCDLWLFAGDRFASRNPYDVTRHRADSALLRRDAATNHKPGLMVVGNHDQWKKNARLGHSMLLTSQLAQSVQVVDSPCKVDDYSGMNMFIVPAGFEGEKMPFEPGSTGAEARIAVYHGMLAGSKYQNGKISDHGWSPDNLNSENYDLVICGDNHAHQRLEMLDKTVGWYVGAPMQHNWGDAGSERGFMYFEYDPATRVVESEFIPTKHPKFIKLEVQAATPKELFNWVIKSKDVFNNNMVRISVIGKNDDLARLDTSSAEAAARKFGARTCEFKPRFDNSAITITANKAVVSDESVWADYLKAKVGSLDGLDADTLAEMARAYFD